MRNSVKFLSGLIVSGIMVMVGPHARALTLSNLSVTDTDSGTVSVSVDVSDTSVTAPAMCFVEATLTNGLSKCYAQPDSLLIVSDQTWTSTNWWPYFRGTYDITVNGMSFSAPDSPPTITQISTPHTVTTNRQVSGTINSIQYRDSQTNWVDVNLSNIALHCMGMMSDQVGGESLACNLLNNTVDIFSGEEQAEDECPFDDIGEHYPAGTVFRFSMGLHARSSTFMGMGLVERYIWTPDDTNSPVGSGTLEFDIMSCSPWRSTADAPLSAHVGFCPIYISEDLAEAELFEGSVMCTTAHYMDVYPTNTSARIGIVVNGHPGSTNYLQVFMPDNLIARWGVTNVETEIGGFVNGELLDPSLVQFTLVEGGTNNIVYDADGNGVGDSGYLVQFTFEYPAQTFRKASANAVVAEIGLTSSVSPTATSASAADFDGDGKADVAVYHEATGYWYIQLSGSGYTLSYQKLGETGYTPTPADYDGDGKADVAVYNERSGYWYIQLSGSGYSLSYQKLGETGYAPAPADYDGDGKADVAVYHEATGYWYIQLSGSGYSLSYQKFGETGYAPVPADYDGDGKADVAVYQESTGYWYIQLSGSSYSLSYQKFGETGYEPVPADYDGDGKTDVAVYNDATGYWYIQLSGSSYSLSYQKFGETGYTPVPGDYDGDGKADVTVYHEATGYWYIQLSGSGYSLSYQKFGELGYKPVK